MTNVTRKTCVEYLSERVENLWRFHFKRELDLSYLYLMQQDILSWLVNMQDKQNSFCFYNLCYITPSPPGSPGPSTLRALRAPSPGWWDTTLRELRATVANVIRSLNWRGELNLLGTLGTELCYSDSRWVSLGPGIMWSRDGSSCELGDWLNPFLLSHETQMLILRLTESSREYSPKKLTWVDAQCLFHHQA